MINILQHQHFATCFPSIGLITIDHVQAHARAYIGTHSRLAQDSKMMYEFLQGSSLREPRSGWLYNTPSMTSMEFRMGLASSRLSWRSTLWRQWQPTWYLREQLMDLPKAMIECKSNVDAFNVHVNEITEDLTEVDHNHRTCIVYLFKAYKEVKDPAFLTYMAHKKEAYEDGTLPLTPHSLMSIALTKYNLLKSQRIGYKRQGGGSTCGSGRSTQGHSPKASKHPTTTRTPHPGKHKKQTLEAWHYENPDNLETMKKDGITYYWCTFDKCWGNHKTERCYKKIAQRQEVSSG